MKLLFVFSLLGIGSMLYSQRDLLPKAQNITQSDGQHRVIGKIVINISERSDFWDFNRMRFERKFANRFPLQTILADVGEREWNADSEKKVYAYRHDSLDIKLEHPINITFDHWSDLKSVQTDESYTLEITLQNIKIHSSNQYGALHALETLYQLLQVDSDGPYFPIVVIKDSPRFVWRGLMIDVCRHFMPIEVIKRNLRAMAAVKMNVFHWHLTEDQGFRIESKVFPKLHELGSEGEYYTQAQIKEVVAYASRLGIRVVPEFDMPGHATAYLVGYPELASKKEVYQVETQYGIFDPTLDPTKEETYAFIEAFLTEMVSLFPDEYIHIGGDENKGHQWDNNQSIQEFMSIKGYENNHQLQAYFNERILTILKRLDKKMVGWDEIFEAGIPKEIVVQSWRGKESLYQVAKEGYPGILSNGYYLDKAFSAADYYRNDPLPSGHNLSYSEQKSVLGGEATMWSELVNPETIDSRIWPATAAIAERLWSPQNSTQDTLDLYRRLKIQNNRLQELGIRNLSYQNLVFYRLINKGDVVSLSHAIHLLEPIKGYSRHRYIRYKTYYPISRLVDALQTDSFDARDLLVMLNSTDASNNMVLETKLTALKLSSFLFVEACEDNYNLNEYKGQAELLRDLISLLLDKIDHKKGLSKRIKALETQKESLNSDVQIGQWKGLVAYLKS